MKLRFYIKLVKMTLENCLSHTQSLTNKDQREFEQLTTEGEKVNRDDFTREVVSSREVFVLRNSILLHHLSNLCYIM